MTFPDLFSGDTESSAFIYSFYMLAGIPIFFSVGIIMLFVRPIYIISSFAIYENYLDKTGEDILIKKAGS